MLTDDGEVLISKRKYKIVTSPNIILEKDVVLNGSLLAKLEKSIPLMLLPRSL